MNQNLIYISYNRSDSSFAVRLAQDLVKFELNVWIDVLNINPGENWDIEVSKALNRARIMICIFPEDINTSRIMMYENSYAIKDRKIIIAVSRYESQVPFRFWRFNYSIFFDEYEYSLYKLVAVIDRSDGHPLILADGEYEIESHPTPEQESKEILRNEVFLGVAVPQNVYKSQEFITQFAAYTNEHRSHVASVFRQESPRSTAIFDLANCEWKVGTYVSVKVSSDACSISNNSQVFQWNGKWKIVRFDIKVLSNYELSTTILKFDILVEGVLVATLRPEVEILIENIDKENNKILSIERPAPKSAFASYSIEDRWTVLNRVRSVQIATNIDVFIDCISLNPGEEWKPAIEREIANREVFWLFWSRNASKSNWVEWEWRTALVLKSPYFIQPHPLEPSEKAPPPRELQELQFGSAYEAYIQLFKPSLRRLILKRIGKIFLRFFK